MTWPFENDTSAIVKKLADLLYRINTIHLEIPSLRERPEDIIPQIGRAHV